VFLLLLVASVAFAPSAAAVDDLTRPDFRVTHGPSCHPGGVQIEVVAGTAPYRVVLATTREPDGEDSAELTPGQTVLLDTGDVDWGETIDSRLEFTALDGSGEVFADELVPYSFTRPAREDCAAIVAPVAAAATPSAPGAATPAPDAGTPADADTPEGAAPQPEVGAEAGSPAPLPGPDGAPAAGAGVPAEGPDLQVQVTASELPVAPVTRESSWALIAAGVALVGTAVGMVVASVRRDRRTRPTPGA